MKSSAGPSVMRRAAGTAMVAALCWLAAFAAPQTGSVRGRVVDENGKPVGDAKVTTTPVDAPGQPEKSTRTDAQGYFVIAGLPWGKYKVGAEKPEVGYPDMSLTFYSDIAEPAPILLTPATPEAHEDFTLRVKAGVLTGIVTDAVSNDPVPATFLLRRADHPEKLLFVEAASHYRILVPSDTDVKLEVAAPGYETWYYPGTMDWKESSPLRIRGTGQIQLDIQLDRDQPGS